MRSLLGVVLVLVAAVGVMPAGAEALTPAVRDFPTGITTGGGPRGIAPGPDGNLWFTHGTSIGKITPAGVASTFSAGVSTHGIAAGPDGNLWFTQPSTDTVAQITPAGVITPFPTGFAFKDVRGIVAGPDGNLWFTEYFTDKIGRITPDGAITEFPAPNGVYEIAAGPDGNLWFAGYLSSTIGRITPAGVVTEFSAGLTPGSGPYGIAAGPDGNLWFTESLSSKIGRITPAGVVTEFSAGLTPGSGPYGIAAGPDGNLWFTEQAAARIGRITPAGTITEFPLAPGGTPVAIAAGADGNLWFTDQARVRIGRITTGAPPMRFSDPAAIGVPAPPGSSGAADPYPATIETEGLPGTVTKVSVRLNGIFHRSASDIEAQLVGPGGQSALLIANSTNLPTDIITPGDVLDGEVVTMADGAPRAPRALTSGVFAPINPGGFALSFAAPAPAAPAPSLAVFRGTDPNGTWKLYVHDDEGSAGTTGRIAGGWSLDIQTTGTPAVQVPGPPVTVAPAADTTRPRLTLTGLPTRLTQAAFRRGVRFRVRPSEPVTLDITLSARVAGARIAARAYPLTLSDLSATVTAAGRALRIRPAADLLGRPARPFAARLRIRASDRAGNRTTVTRSITVRPDVGTRRS